MTVTELTPASVCCTGCGARLPAAGFNTGNVFRCGSCGTTLLVAVFPALFRPISVNSGELLTAEGVASCFYHPQKKAAALCAACGRFLCTLCETDLAGRCLCPSCIEQGRANESIEELVTHRPLHDSLALSLAIIPLLVFPVTLLTAPAVLFIALYFWKKPGSILPRTRVRFVLAALIALAEIGGWLAVLATKMRWL